jgi:hypothetical protein
MHSTMDRRNPCLSWDEYHVVENSTAGAGTVYSSLVSEKERARRDLVLLVLVMVASDADALEEEKELLQDFFYEYMCGE